ncbi:MAG: Hsp33 family molecular chaperone HslO, partial [Clostridia bacterium]
MAELLRAMTKDGSARALIINSRDIVNKAIQIHHTSPTATAALGRTLSAAALMGSIMPERDDLLTLRFKGDGNGGAIVVSSDYSGNVRGFIENPCVDLPLKATGKLDVSSCVGHGQLFVLRDTGNKQPYVGVSN